MLDDERGDRQQMGDKGDGGSLARLLAMKIMSVAQGVVVAGGEDWNCGPPIWIDCLLWRARAVRGC
jgi:hypothetical protein